MPPIRSITVYCSSSSSIPEVYRRAGKELGTAIAKNGWALIYGGNNCGLMGTLADAARAGGGKVVGITPQLFIDKGQHDQNCDELVVSTDMRHRKMLLEQRADAFVALPGGLGTFDEIFDVLACRVLGYHDKPIVLVNIENYYGPLMQMVQHGIEQKFINASVLKVLHVAPTVSETIAILGGRNDQ